MRWSSCMTVFACAIALGCGATATPARSKTLPTSDAPTTRGNPHADVIRVSSPRPTAQVRSPLVITGEARGAWYFEATFPVQLLDANGTVIAEHYATAQGEWMTEAFVPFRAELPFAPPKTWTGTLVLQKNNPSDMRDLDDELRVPIRFAPTSSNR